MVTGNRYLPRGSDGNVLCITTTGNGNVFVARWVMPLVTIPFLEFCYDLLNSLNSVKFIWGKFQYQGIIDHC